MERKYWSKSSPKSNINTLVQYKTKACKIQEDIQLLREFLSYYRLFRFIIDAHSREISLLSGEANLYVLWEFYCESVKFFSVWKFIFILRAKNTHRYNCSIPIFLNINLLQNNYWLKNYTKSEVNNGSDALMRRCIDQMRLSTVSHSRQTESDDLVHGRRFKFVKWRPII